MTPMTREQFIQEINQGRLEQLLLDVNLLKISKPERLRSLMSELNLWVIEDWGKAGISEGAKREMIAILRG